jgi:UDP-glucose 4-epimerase
MSTNEVLIVFGANGFLGSVITKRLHFEGKNVIAVVRPGAIISRLSHNLNLNIQEIDSANWPSLIRERNPKTIIVAQWDGVREADRDNFEKQERNISQITQLALAANESGVANFLAFGSQAEVSRSLNLIEEKFYDSGISQYGKAKTQLFRELEKIFRNSGTRFFWARIFSVYGPNDNMESLLSQLHLHKKRDTNFVIRNPSMLWSFLFEEDFARAILALIESDIHSGIVNIANPNLVSIREIVSIWQDTLVTARNMSINRLPGFFPVTTKLDSIGWKPEVSLEDGVQIIRNMQS